MGRHVGAALARADETPFVPAHHSLAVDISGIAWEQRLRNDEERRLISQIRVHGPGTNNENYLHYAEYLEAQETEADDTKARIVRDMCALASQSTLSAPDLARKRHYTSFRVSEEIGKRIAPFNYGQGSNVALRNGLIDEITISGTGEGAGLVASVAKAHPIRKLHLLECGKHVASILADGKVMEGVEELTLRGCDPEVTNLGHIAPKLSTLTCHPLETARICGRKGSRVLRELNVVGGLPEAHEDTRRWKLIGQTVRIDAVSASYRSGAYSFLDRFVQSGITTSLDINANIDEDGIATIKRLAPSLKRLTIRGYSLSSEDFVNIFSTHFPKLRELTLCCSNADRWSLEALIRSGTSHNLEVVTLEGTHIQRDGFERLDSSDAFPNLISLSVS